MDAPTHSSTSQDGTVRGSPRAQRIGAVAFLTALTLVAYQPLLPNRRVFEFLNIDDARYVVENPRVTGGITGENVMWAFTSLHQSNWHPLTWMSWQLDAQLFGVDSWGFHLTNLAIHLANAILLFVVLHRATGAWGRSVMVAALFGVHPLHVESVAWVSERKDLLSTLFFLLTLLIYVSYAARPTWRRYCLVLLLFALGLMAKSMLVTLPFVLLLFDAWPLRRARVAADSQASGPSPHLSWARLVGEKVPLMALAVACAFITLRAQERMRDVLPPLPASTRVANAAVYYVTYLGRAVWPFDLVAYHRNAGVMLGGAAVLGSVLLVLVVTVVSVRERSRRPYLLTGWLWYLGTLVPVIGLVQVGFLATADHYTYVPLIGFSLMVVWAGEELLARALPRPAVGARVACVLAAGVLFTCVLVTRSQLRYWRTSATLWAHIVDSVPGDAMAQAFLAQALEARGESAAAEEHYARAAELDTTWQRRLHEGLELEAKGDLWGARRELEAVLMSAPHNLTAVQHLAAQFQARGEIGDAIKQYSTWALIDPRDAAPEYQLGILYGQAGDATRAEDHLRKALTRNPDFDAAREALARVSRMPGDAGDAAGPNP